MSNKPLRDQQKIWYKKLKDNGFVDIEYDENHLRMYSIQPLTYNYNGGKSYTEVAAIREAKTDYYRLAGHYLHDHEFDRGLDRIIWTMHSEGIPYRDIVAAVKKLGMDCSKDRVSKTIATHRAKMYTLYRGRHEQK